MANFLIFLIMSFDDYKQLIYMKSNLVNLFFSYVKKSGSGQSRATLVASGHSVPFFLLKCSSHVAFVLLVICVMTTVDLHLPYPNIFLL